MDKPLPSIWGSQPDSDRPSKRKPQRTSGPRVQQQARWPSPTRRAQSLPENIPVKEFPLRGLLHKTFSAEKSQQVSYRGLEVASMSDEEEKKISPTDIVIAVMGVTGAGKSTFIQELTDDELEIGDKLHSCTVEVNPHRCNQPGYENVWLIDTPGFDDTERTDADILHEIGEYLVQASADKIFLTGIIYLHRIQDPRIGNAAMRNIRMFKKLCGEDGLSRTTLVTTFWAGVKLEEGEQREEELLTNSDLWRVIREKGGKAFRYQHKNKASAKTVVSHIIESKLGPGILQFQKEMDNGKTTILETQAGIQVNDTMEKLKMRYQTEIEDLKKELEEAKTARNNDVKQLRKEFEETEKKLQKVMRDRELLSATKDGLRGRMRAKVVRARHGKCSIM